MSIGENIKSRRKALNMQQGDLAKAVGVSQAMICQIERGTKVPSMPLGAETPPVSAVRLTICLRGRGGESNGKQKEKDRQNAHPLHTRYNGWAVYPASQVLLGRSVSGTISDLIIS